MRYYSPQDVTGINISAKQLETCKMNAPGCTFLLMDATELAFEGNSFDNVICVEAAFHFHTREKFLREAHRVLKPSGRLVLSDILMTRWMEERNPLRTMDNYITNMEEYSQLCVGVGFEHVDIIDATHECWIQYYRHFVRFLHDQLARRAIDPPTFRQIMDQKIRAARTLKYYLLVSALKADAH